MECVCPPQTSMITQGLVTVRRISSRIFFATRSSRYSSRYFIGPVRSNRFAELVHLFQVSVSAGGLLLIHLADGEADVDHHVIADLASGRYSRQASRVMPPKSTFDIRTPSFS